MHYPVAMKLPRARILSTTWKEDFVLELGRMARMVPGFSTILVILTWVFALIGIALSLIVPVAFFMHGDILGLILLAPASAIAMFEIFQITQCKRAHPVTRFVWPLLIGLLPYIGAFIYRSSQWRPAPGGGSTSSPVHYF